MANTIKMPQLGLTMEEGTVERWLKAVGDLVKAGEPLLEVTTDKLTNTVDSEIDGVLLAILAPEGTDVPVKGLLGYIGAAGEAVPAADLPAAEVVVQTAPVEAAVLVTAVPQDGKKMKISPLAKKMAQNNGIDYTKLVGTGPNGRIIKRDILAAEKSTAPTAPVAEKSVAPQETFPVKNLERMDGDIVEKLTGMRRVVAQRMTDSAREIPTVTQTMKVDVTALLAFRTQLNAGRERKLSVNDFVLKAVAKALRRNPNCLVSLDGEQIIRRKHINLGMAVALDEGLIVPVIRDADQLGLEELSVRAKDLATRARENKLTGDEYKGSTFTISNLGMFGVESFTPIINQPDAAILGVNCIDDELVLREDGTVTKRQVLRLSLTYDHRLMDGSTAAKLEQSIRDLLQSPLDILL